MRSCRKKRFNAVDTVAFIGAKECKCTGFSRITRGARMSFFFPILKVENVLRLKVMFSNVYISGLYWHRVLSVPTWTVFLDGSKWTNFDAIVWVDAWLYNHENLYDKHTVRVYSYITVIILKKFCFFGSIFAQAPKVMCVFPVSHSVLEISLANTIAWKLLGT